MEVEMNQQSTNVPVVGEWGEIKYKLLEQYVGRFATGMKDKWDVRVYIDLYSGPGKVRLVEGGEIIHGSPLIALNARHPFDLYVFCDERADNIDQLSRYCDDEYPEADTRLVVGDANDCVDELIKQLPQPGKGNTVLALCVVDPYKIADFRFETIRRLSARFMDFFMLIPSFMDGHRNPKTYLKEDCPKLDGFFGDREWRGDWAAAKQTNVLFGNFIFEQLAKRMAILAYEKTQLIDAELVRNVADKNQRLYHLALFSRDRKSVV